MKEKLEILKLKGELFIGKIKTLMLVILLFVEILIVTQYLIEREVIKIPNWGGKNVAVVNFNKEITANYVNKVMNDMDDALENSKYEEVLFIMNSPGGSPSASEEMSEYLKDLSKKIKVTMYVQTIAASGGYYIASAIKPLIANKNAIIGSIGVIMPHYNFEKIAKKIGIEEDDLSMGEYKKPISLLSKITDKNRDYLTKQLLSPMYENFLASVAKNRGITVEKLRPYGEGIIYMANSPKIKGLLIDEISTLNKIKDKIKKSYDKKINFINVIKKNDGGLFGPKVNFNIDTEGLLSNNSGVLK